MRHSICCVVLFIALLAGCAPTAAGLRGTWTNLDDDGVWRVFEFAAELEDASVEGVEPDFFLYFYADGAEAQVEQRGWYEVYSPENDNIPCDTVLDFGCDDDREYLVTHVLWSLTSGNEGDYSNEILAFSGSSMTLESTAEPDGRVFDKSNGLP